MLCSSNEGKKNCLNISVEPFLLCVHDRRLLFLNFSLDKNNLGG